MMRIFSITIWIGILSMIASSFSNASPITKLNGSWRCTDCWIKEQGKRNRVRCSVKFRNSKNTFRQSLSCRSNGVSYRFRSVGRISRNSISGRWSGRSRHGSASGISRGSIHKNSMNIWFSAPRTRGKLSIDYSEYGLSISIYGRTSGSYRKVGGFNLRR